MKNYLVFVGLASLLVASSLVSCNIPARLSKKSYAYVWEHNKGQSPDQLVRRQPLNSGVRVKITENSGYLSIIPIDTSEIAVALPIAATLRIEPIPPGFRTDIRSTLYYPEVKYDTSKVKTHFRYTQLKSGLQAMSVLLKWRGAIPKDEVPELPQTVEAGTSLGFAYGLSHTWNSYHSEKNFWGSNITTYSITAGPMLGCSAVDLKSASNAPGLGLDRKSAVLSYGGFVMFGTGPINFGYAIGADRVLGYGASKWVYGGKVWHGLIVGLKVLTF